MFSLVHAPKEMRLPTSETRPARTQSVNNHVGAAVSVNPVDTSLHYRRLCCQWAFLKDLSTTDQVHFD